jgi:hypothetical protein
MGGTDAGSLFLYDKDPAKNKFYRYNTYDTDYALYPQILFSPENLDEFLIDCSDYPDYAFPLCFGWEHYLIDNNDSYCFYCDESLNFLDYATNLFFLKMFWGEKWTFLTNLEKASKHFIKFDKQSFGTMTNPIERKPGPLSFDERHKLESPEEYVRETLNWALLTIKKDGKHIDLVYPGSIGNLLCRGEFLLEHCEKSNYASDLKLSTDFRQFAYIDQDGQFISFCEHIHKASGYIDTIQNCWATWNVEEHYEGKHLHYKYCKKDYLADLGSLEDYLIDHFVCDIFDVQPKAARDIIDKGSYLHDPVDNSNAWRKNFQEQQNYLFKRITQWIFDEGDYEKILSSVLSESV